MKHGIVMNSRGGMLYGSAANNWLAQSSAAHCLSQEEAIEKVQKSAGSFREALVVALRGRGFDIPEELVAKLRGEEEEKERQARERAQAKHREEWRAEPLVPAAGRSPCKFCDQPIKKGEVCHERETKRGSKTLRSRVHPQCAEEPKG